MLGAEYAGPERCADAALPIFDVVLLAEDEDLVPGVFPAVAMPPHPLLALFVEAKDGMPRGPLFGPSPFKRLRASIS